jgi:hypothetical protein
MYLFIHVLRNDISSWDYIVSRGRKSSEPWIGKDMEATCCVLTRSMDFEYSDWGKSTKNVSQDRQFPGRYLNLEPPE